MAAMANLRTTRSFGLLEEFLARKRAQRANNLIPQSYRSGRILDVGCGTYPAFLLLTAFTEKYGIDKTYSALWQTELKDRSLTLMNHDIEHEAPLPFRDDYFDTVTMLAVFEHITHDNLPRALRELNRVLKRGGLLVITTPAKWTGFILNGMARLRLISSLEIKDHKGLYTADIIFTTLQHGGFSLENIKLGYFEFYMNTWVTAIK